MLVFEYTNYKIFLRDSIQSFNRRGLISEIAKAAGCTHSYLSQVLSGKPDLTPDQAFGVAEFLQLSQGEAKFFLLLTLKARAATSKLIKHYETQMHSLIELQLQTKKAIESTTDYEIAAQDRDFYYSTWSTPLIHILTSCGEYQTVPKLVARTRLDSNEVVATLEWLLKRGLITKVESLYIHSGKNIHLPTNSIHNRINHLNWRLRSQEYKEINAGIHYTSLFAINKGDGDRLKSRLLAFIETQRTEISNSGSEEVLVFCCDFFQP